MARTPVPADGSAPVVGMSADGIDRLRADAVLSLLGGLIDTSDRPVVFVDLAGDVGPRLGLRGRPGVGEVVHGRETLDAVLVSVPCDRLPRSVRSRPDGPRTGDGSDPETEPGSFRALPAGQLAVRDAEADWHDYAPGIRRRVLWSHAGEASMLYDARPGAQVPQHAHGHDEECLMVDGEAFLDDVLLRRLDYQLAPAGTMHQGVSTDSGGVIFAHGDLDLDLRPD